MESEKEKLFFISLLLCVFISGGNACFTSNQVKFIKIKTGSSFYRECTCDDPSSEVNLMWLDVNNNTILPLGPGTKSNVYSEWLNKRTYSLFISNIDKIISGAYKCVTENHGRQYTLTYNVEAYDPPYFVNTKENQYVVSGTDGIITCEARGEGDLLISWHKEGEGLEITDDEKYKVTSEGLIIKDIKKEDEGVYKCAASDLEAGEGIDRDIKLEVTSVPSIEELVAFPSTTPIVGGSFFIECLASGAPHPEYTFHKISDMDLAETNITWQQVGNRMIFDVVQEEDSGTYQCNATNRAGISSKNISIEVFVPPVITEFDNVTAVEGSTIQIVCKATGRPAPQINVTFLHEDSEDQSIVWEKRNPSANETELYLSFLRVNRTHGGVYQCIATNEVDSSVEEMHFFVLYQPYFNSSYEKVWAWKDKSVNLSCAHQSNPKAEITWRYQGNEIVAEDLLEINRIMADKMHNDPLIIKNKLLYGVYECTAKNEFGEAKKIIRLQEGFVPPAINNVTITKITSHSVTFSIEGPNEVNGPEVIGYQSEYDETNNYNVTNIHFNRTWSIDRQFVLDRLKPNTSYVIKFAALNDVGIGPWSDMFNFVTLVSSLPDEPVWDENVEQLVASDRVLKWKPADSEESVQFYSVKYCPIYDGLIASSLCEEEQIERTDEFQLNKIDANTTYYFELVAHNALGNSSTAHIIVTIPAEKEPTLSSGAIAGIAISIIFLCLVLLDVILLICRKKGIIAICCYKKTNKREVSINSRDKKNLLKDNPENNDKLQRPNNGHREYEYNKTTGVITGKHSSV